LKQAQLAVEIAGQKWTAAKAAMLPQFAMHGAFEADRQQFVRKGGANWLISASLRWNIFDGYANRARVAEAKAITLAAQAQQKAAAQGVRLEVFKSWAESKAAEERVAVANAAVAQAEESLRINKNRFESGLANVTELLRNETAVFEAQLRRIAALHDQRMAAVQLEFATGTLSPESEILK
jgi:outer membrane protein TolC